MTKSRAALIISLALLVVILHIVGLSLEFYWRLGWYDRIVHTLSGITVVLTLFSFSAVRRFSNKLPIFFLEVFFAALLVGLLWEVFELQAGITFIGDHGYMFDTTWDIICDVIGGILAGGYLFLFD